LSLRSNCINSQEQALLKITGRAFNFKSCGDFSGKQIVRAVVNPTKMLQDLFRIQAALGGSSSQSGTNLHKRFKAEEQQDEEATDFGLEGPETDCHIYTIAGTTTMDWLKSHHLIDLS